MNAASKAWRILRIAVGLSFTAGFAYLAFRHVDWKAAGDAVSRADPVWFVAGFAVMIPDYTLRILRWWLMLRRVAPGTPFSRSIGPFLASVSLDNVLGFRAGDLARTAGFQKYLGVSPMQVFGTLLMERTLGLASLLVLFFYTLRGVRPDGFPPVFVTAGYWIALACLVLLLFLLFTPGRLLGLADRMGRISETRGWVLPARISGWALQFFGSLCVIRSPGLVGGLLVLSLAIWVIEGVVYFLMGQSLSVGIPGVWPWFALSTGTLATAFPSAPGSLGTFDYFAIMGAVAYQVPQAKAIVLALLVHVILWLPGTLTGLGWLAFYAGRQTAPGVDSSARTGADELPSKK